MNSEILFVGDSITHGNDWSKNVDFARVENLAIPGYTTDDVVNQLSEISNLNPNVISLLIGTNDLGNEALNRSGEDVGQRVVSIIDSIVSMLPAKKLVVNSILPRDLVFTDRITVANSIIKSYKHERVTYLDVWPTLALDNYLNPNYLLVDGFDAHLNENGYKAWAGVLIPVLKKSYL